MQRCVPPSTDRGALNRNGIPRRGMTGDLQRQDPYPAPAVSDCVVVPGDGRGAVAYRQVSRDRLDHDRNEGLRRVRVRGSCFHQDGVATHRGGHPGVGDSVRAGSGGSANAQIHVRCKYNDESLRRFMHCHVSNVKIINRIRSVDRSPQTDSLHTILEVVHASWLPSANSIEPGTLRSDSSCVRTENPMWTEMAGWGCPRRVCSGAWRPSMAVTANGSATPPFRVGKRVPSDQALTASRLSARR